MADRILSPHEIKGHSRSHHKVLVKDESTIKTYQGKKVCRHSYDLPSIYDTMAKVQDRLTGVSGNVVIGYNAQGVLEIHWWSTNLVIKENDNG